MANNLYNTRHNEFTDILEKDIVSVQNEIDFAKAKFESTVFEEKYRWGRMLDDLRQEKGAL